MTINLKYSDPLILNMRSGNYDDPYIDISEPRKIVHSQVVLSEIPDEFNHVAITGYSEIFEGIPTSVQFIVDYSRGLATFNRSEEGKIVNVSYKGTGGWMIPAERVVLHSDNPDIEQNLQGIIDNGNNAIQANVELSAKLDAVDQAITDANDAVTRANTAIDQANTATANASTATDNANTAITAADTAKINADAAANAANTATTAANDAATAANTAKSNADIATTNANNAATSANNAATAANTAKTNADTAATNANNAATLANNAASAANTSTTNVDTATTNANNAASSANTAATNANTAIANFTNVGIWDSVIAYKNKNIVSYNGSSYMAVQDNTNQLPTDTTYWKLLSFKGDTGSTGPQGATGTSFVWKGAYSSSVTYNINDCVSYNGSGYVCKVNGTVNIVPTTTANWDIYVQKGIDGSGSVSSVSSTNGDITIINETTTPLLTLNSGTGANQVLKLDANGQASANIVLQDTTHKFVSDSEKETWNDKYTKSETDNKISTAISNLDWKPSVATYNDIATTYPTPVDGWTVTVRDTDDTYRYTGTQWINIGSTSPLVTQTNDGLMTKEDKIKLDGIQSSAINQITADGLYVAKTSSIGLSGDATGSVTLGSATNTITVTLANTTVTAGTYKSVTVDSKGRVTGGTNPTTLADYGITDAISTSGGTVNGSLTVSSSLTVGSAKDWGILSSAPAITNSGDRYFDSTLGRQLYYGKKSDGTSGWIDPVKYQ